MVSRYLKELLKEMSYALSYTDFTVETFIKEKERINNSKGLNYVVYDVTLRRFGTILLKGTVNAFIGDVDVPLYYEENALAYYDNKVWVGDVIESPSTFSINTLEIERCEDIHKVNAVLSRHGMIMSDYLSKCLDIAYWKSIQDDHLSESDYSIPDEE